MSPSASALQSLVMQPTAAEAGLARDVTAAAGGDRVAYGRIVDATRNLVTAISLAIVRDVPLSEDVAQEAYLEAWQGLPRLRSAASFLPWLRQLTRNRAHDLLRRRGRRATVALDGDVGDPRPDARAELIGAEEQAALAEALDELPPPSREVIALFYREGQSAAQVAALLGLREAAVKKRLQRARDELRAGTLERLGEVARKSAPAAGFTAAVLGALAIGAPATATAATIAAANAGAAANATAGKLAATSLAAPASLAAKLAAAAAGSLAGALAGSFGVVNGVRKVWRRARDAEERRALVRFAIANVAFTLAGAVGMPLGHALAPSGVGLAFAFFFLMWLPIALSYSFWLPRIVARREALERAEDLGAARRQRRERRMSRLGLALGTLLGGGTVVFVVLRLHHLL